MSLWKRVAILLGAVLFLSRCSNSFVDDVTGKWKGTWTSGNRPGFLFEYTMFLEMDEDLRITGEIHWILRKSPRDHEQSKIGLSGIEYVKGTGNKADRSISLTGYKQDDPNAIIGLDNYELSLKKGGRRIAGKTYSNGTWEGRFVGEKTE